MSTLVLEHIKHADTAGPNLSVDSNGNIGIGTSTPVSYGKLHIKAGNGTQLVLDNAGEQYTQMYFNNNGVYKAAIWADNRRCSSAS